MVIGCDWLREGTQSHLIDPRVDNYIDARRVRRIMANNRAGGWRKIKREQ